LTVLLLF